MRRRGGFCASLCALRENLSRLSRLLAGLHATGDTGSCDAVSRTHTRLLPVHTLRPAPPAGWTCVWALCLPRAGRVSGLFVSGLLFWSYTSSPSRGDTE